MDGPITTEPQCTGCGEVVPRSGHCARLKRLERLSSLVEIFAPVPPENLGCDGNSLSDTCTKIGPATSGRVLRSYCRDRTAQPLEPTLTHPVRNARRRWIGAMNVVSDSRSDRSDYSSAQPSAPLDSSSFATPLVLLKNR